MSGQRKAAAPKTRKASGKSPSRAAGQGKGPRSLRRRILKWTAILFGTGVVLLGAAFAYAYASIDVPNPNAEFEAETTFVYYADGETVLGKFATQDRVSISLSDMPDHVKEAVIAAEDRSFYTNSGIDPKGILRAAFSNARGNSTQGASTITQQYVKILYLTQERTLSRKVKEAFLSLKIQRQQSKNEILQGYLNTIYFGRGAYGIEAAARAYFDKPAAKLTVREGAALAAILNSPNNYDPAGGREAKERLFSRYQYVLSGMAEMGALSADEADKAARRLPKFPPLTRESGFSGQRGYVMQMVRRELISKGFTDSEIDGGGLRVTTTISQKVMAATQNGVKEQRPDGLKQLHVATASVEPATGALRGFYAGQDYEDSQGGLNWAVEGGAPGSTFKPFGLAAALDYGYALDSTFEGNSPLVIGNTEFNNQGEGLGSSFGSRISLLDATEKSVNTAYVDLVDTMPGGADKVVDMAVAMGIPKDARDLNREVGIVLGSAIVSPIDMANAYGTIADGGQAKDWFVVDRVTDADGEVRFKHRVRKDRAFSEDVAADTSYALQQTAEEGTATDAQLEDRPIAAKTGTATDDNGNVRSSWLVGYTPQLATAVMYVRGDGNDPLDGYMPSFYGGDFPAETWKAIMSRAMDGRDVVEFPEPADLEQTVEGNEPVPTFTPKPTPTKKPKPTPTEEPTPTPTPEPTKGPPSDPGPPPEPTPTESCSLLGGCETVTPTPTPEPEPSNTPPGQQDKPATTTTSREE